MSQIAFLFDEQVPPALANALLALEPAIELISVGQPDAPPKRTSDPEILEFAAKANSIVVSFDKNTMVGFAVERIMAGLPMKGLFVIPSDQVPISKVADDLLLVWSNSLPEEWENRIEYLPL